MSIMCKVDITFLLIMLIIFAIGIGVSLPKRELGLPFDYLLFFFSLFLLISTFAFFMYQIWRI